MRPPDAPQDLGQRQATPSRRRPGASPWLDPLGVALAGPGAHLPSRVNGIPMRAWAGAPSAPEGWRRRAQGLALEEPEWDAGRWEPRAGAVVVEPDGRAWVAAASGRSPAFPAGRALGLDLRAAALQEAWEHLGLKIDLFAHLVDVEADGGRVRYYLARRVGGTPSEAGRASRAAMLAPVEFLGSLVGRPADRRIIQSLEKRWGEWAGWFDLPDEARRDFAEAARGRIPARRDHWHTLPLPAARARIPLDLRFEGDLASSLKLGFIPREMEQKWFAYYQEACLFEHRSWTGICVSRIHFLEEGPDLHAVWAEVNRYPAQVSGRDDAEDARQIEARLRRLSTLNWEDRDPDDPFAIALREALEPED